MIAVMYLIILIALFYFLSYIICRSEDFRICETPSTDKHLLIIMIIIINDLLIIIIMIY